MMIAYALIQGIMMFRYGLNSYDHFMVDVNRLIPAIPGNYIFADVHTGGEACIDEDGGNGFRRFPIRKRCCDNDKRMM